MTGVYRHNGTWWAIIDGVVADRTFGSRVEARAFVRKIKGWDVRRKAHIIEYQEARA
jgi:hypothetical protein